MLNSDDLSETLVLLELTEDSFQVLLVLFKDLEKSIKAK
jgi:hypothetical protein